VQERFKLDDVHRKPPENAGACAGRIEGMYHPSTRNREFLGSVCMYWTCCFPCLVSSKETDRAFKLEIGGSSLDVYSIFLIVVVVPRVVYGDG
jgi:hypothetical protein